MGKTPKEVTPLDELKRILDAMGEEFKAVLPENIRPESFIRILKTAISMDSRLIGANRQSLYAEAMKCAQDGLVPDGREAVLNVYKNTVKYMPMVYGILKRARNSGEVATIDAKVVHEKDEYDNWTDEKGDHFKFKRARVDRGKPILTFAYCLTKDGALYFEEMDESQLEAVESMSQNSKEGNPWKGKFRDEMKRKSVIRRLSKRLPSASDLDRIITRDDDLYDLSRQGRDPAAPKPKSRVAALVGAPEKKEPAPEPDPEGDNEEATGGEEETPI